MTKIVFDSVEDKSEPEFPPEIYKWNWGAFLLSFFWSISNGVWIGLLVLVFPIGIIMPFVLGTHGSKWAWQKGDYSSVEEFMQEQRKWRNAGLAVVGAFWMLMVLLSVILSATWTPLVMTVILSCAFIYFRKVKSSRKGKSHEKKSPWDFTKH
ncbi:MAG: ribonuclease G [Actinomycetota bacterium]|jgi:hypothetical protein|nr:ribonuclease G [Actinomycetota bacterium]MCL6093572.1 ribonuclease G [Actinomycetota bacterium]MDA8166160.1 ribonuclease G [Actinomycetota bacterium]